jgi:ribonucleoside-diphosphate reductase alpha chain
LFVEEWLGKENQLGIDIWKKKYQRNGESFEDWLERVSGGDADVVELIVHKKFLFGGRILSNRGIDDEKVTYSNCYVITPPEDNIESIYDTAKKLARTYSYGGGCGIDISKLAPCGAKVNNQAKSTSGAVSFMDTFSQVTEQIGQNGRRGALMISIDCTHPDLEKFITVKSDLNKVTSANISVRVTDRFMVAVKNDEDWELYYKRDETGEEIKKTVKARDIFDLLCRNNWDYAEPGILYWDRITNWNLVSNDKDFEYAGVNPCAEEPLPAGGSCLLGAINLAAFADNGKFDWDDFNRTVNIAVRTLNDVLDEGLERHPLAEQRKTVRDWRQIGLGIMGLADMLIKLGIEYGSPDSITLCDSIGYSMARNAIVASAKVAKDIGCYYNWDIDKVTTSPFFTEHIKADDNEAKLLIHMNGLRNSQLLTIAPTGSISTMIGVSGGIEPIFANYYERTTKSLHGHDEVYKVYTPIVKEYMDDNGIKDELGLPSYFVTSATIPIKRRIDMQSVWQKHIDASISSTVNLPNEATVDDVKDLYMYAWEKHLKGITVYRAGCKRAGILNAEPKKDDEAKPENTSTILPRGSIIEPSNDLIGKKRKIQTGCGSLHVLAFFDPIDGNLQEVYFNKGSTGGCANFMTGLSRMVSLLCRAGVDIMTIKDQLDSTGVCPSYATRKATHHDTSKGSCCPMAIGNALVEMYNEMQSELDDKEDDTLSSKLNATFKELEEASAKTTKSMNEIASALRDIGQTCPECGEPLVFEGGCCTCKSCGYTKCE